MSYPRRWEWRHGLRGSSGIAANSLGVVSSPGARSFLEVLSAFRLEHYSVAASITENDRQPRNHLREAAAGLGGLQEATIGLPCFLPTQTMTCANLPR